MAALRNDADKMLRTKYGGRRASDRCTTVRPQQSGYSGGPVPRPPHLDMHAHRHGGMRNDRVIAAISNR